MKALTYISGLALLVLSSCSSGLYMSSEYDDLYYTSSDRLVEGTTVVVRNRPVERDLRAEEYYDNIYAADTLVSEEYAEAAVYGDEAKGESVINNYYFDNSYSGRLRSFYGNYFDPYWRDPFYYSYHPYSAYSYGAWGYPYSYGYYDPFYYDPFYYDPFYYGSFSRYGYYGSYGSYYPYYYSSFYSPFYNSYYGYYYNDEVSNVSYGRRERPSTLSTRYNNSVSGGVSSASRRDTYLSGDVAKTDGDVAKSAVQNTPVNRRSVSSDINRSTPVTTRAAETQNPVRQSTDAVTGTATRRVAVERPEYNSTSRSYTPSYTNPPASTRPSYNNTRVGTSSSSGTTRVIQAPSGVRSGSSVYSPSRSGTGSSGVYSVPSRSSGSSSSGTRSYSAPSSRSSSYSSGSSNSGSYGGGSSSSGSSSSGSSSSGSSRSSGSSGGRR